MNEPSTYAAAGTGGSAGVAEEVRYWKSSHVEITPFIDTTTSQFLVRTGANRFYTIPEPLAVLLGLLDGTRTLVEVAAMFSASRKRDVTPADIETLISRELVPRGLVQDALASAERIPAPAKLSRKIDFIYRVPLLTARQISPVTTRLGFLFDKYLAFLLVLLIGIAHFLLYATPAHSGRLTFQPLDLLIAYGLCFLTVCFHELGHAAACRRFGCDHEEIGFCLYFVFPAMYVNLSRAWQLPREQRAVIDIGGIYFQQILFIPLLAAHFLWGQPFLKMVLYSIDAMTIFSLNPFLKFDGYWLLVDTTGIANLHKRTFGLIRDLGAALIGQRRSVDWFPGLKSSQRRVLSVYAVSLVLLMVYFIPRLAWGLPNRLARVLTEGALTFAAARHDPSEFFVHLRAFLFAALVIPLLIRLAVLAKRHIGELWKPFR